METIYTLTDLEKSSYKCYLKHLYGINDKLKRDGIMAPDELSLKNMATLYEKIGAPLDNILAIHVGGTNGKGSTSYKLAEALRSCGVKTGLFVSPHICSYRERIQVDGVLIPEEQVVQLLPQVYTLCIENRVPATLFELTFILACLYYKEAGCEAVVLEVGLGGALDATNVVNATIGIICSVSLDHTRILGSSVEEIATKKAGIFKKKKLALAGPQVPLHVLKSIAKMKEATFATLDEVFSRFGLSNCILSDTRSDDTRGGGEEDTDMLNARLSLAALCLLSLTHFGTIPEGSLPEHVSVAGNATERALRRRIVLFASQAPSESTRTAAVTVTTTACLPHIKAALLRRPPCRWEKHRLAIHLPHKPNPSLSPSSGLVDGNSDKVTVEVVLDVGHNPAAISALVKRLQSEYAGRNVRLVYAVSRDKDMRECIRTISAAVPHDHIHFAQSDNFRAASRQELAAIFLEETGGSPISHIPSSGLRDFIMKVIHLAALDAGPLRNDDPVPVQFSGSGGALGVWAIGSLDGDNKTAAANATSVVVICGTGYIMGDARAVLGISEPRDSDDLNF